MKDQAVADAAIAYARIGWAVLPLKPRDKRPLTPHGVNDATTDLDRIRQWWHQWPEANIGLACGEISGVVALDLDQRHGGLLWWESYVADNGTPEGTYQTFTGGGGEHYLFQYSGEANVDITTGVEVKSDGKYIVLPPSIHPSGNPYEWELSSNPLDDDHADATDAGGAPGVDTVADPGEIFKAIPTAA